MNPEVIDLKFIHLLYVCTLALASPRGDFFLVCTSSDGMYSGISTVRFLRFLKFLLLLSILRRLVSIYINNKNNNNKKIQFFYYFDNSKTFK